jgi:LacI family transcriptional regulator
MTTLSGSNSADSVSRPARRSTMRDVASLAGVSVKSVSRVINEEKGVSEDVRRRVTRAAEQLQYSPDFTASNLRRSDRRTSSIGLLVEDVLNEFSASVNAGVAQAAAERGVVVLTAFSTGDPAREREAVRAFSVRRVDGLVAIPLGGDDSSVWTQRDFGAPVVFVDRSPKGVVADCVLTNNREGARELMTHLMDRGHRKIAFLGGINRLETAQERYAGYVDALSGQGLPTKASWVKRDLRDADAARDAVEQLLSLDDPPTAIFAAQNLLCMGAFRALASAERQHSLALVSFDDFALADLLDPAVTVIAQDPRQMGYRAAQVLFERMDAGAGAPSAPGNDTASTVDRVQRDAPAMVHEIPFRLVVRESSLIDA